MQVAETIEALRAWRAAVSGVVGFVPTMGALHDGHLSLVRRARRECERVAVSIFVNPAQFGPLEDFQSYPRDLSRDLNLLGAEGVDLVFVPAQSAIYPEGFVTWVTVERLAKRWEGASRPGHFRGVATVVLKLLNLVRPERAYFGEKDYQQLRVVERLVRDLGVPTAIVPCPTVREPDGLALSSRNAYFSPEERRAATVLWRALAAALDECVKGERSTARLCRVVKSVIGEEPLARLDYVAVADPETLEPVKQIDQRGAVCCLAAWVGKVRLIDNVRLEPVPSKGEERA
jgi:pantoate--beta-alanine ligase